MGSISLSNFHKLSSLTQNRYSEEEIRTIVAKYEIWSLRESMMTESLKHNMQFNCISINIEDITQK